MRPHKPYVVRAPVGVSLQTIQQFLKCKEKWMQKHHLQFLKTRQETPRLAFGEKIPLLGQKRTLKMAPTLLPKGFVSHEENEEFLQVYWPLKKIEPSQQELHHLVRTYYRRMAHQLILGRLEHWILETGFNPTQVCLREAKSRWGSCNSKGNISLNWKLVVFELDLIDSVIVHELCHLKHLNHSPQFWAEVERWLPNYPKLSVQLKEKGSWANFLHSEE